eukprot:CAMPEP_0175143056 /NCGR_PEP_ID=MMETSP0087-20121206/13195_1 /TAXON_ID=136419 /ORGANISM="Unknown Unknown, Strain D1" /LENGTH=393 /DNA_ID=CAMNT_0016427033 /DNA_START=57 /DNA_END=1235 /DNA_ORIENTATION=+
MKLLQTLGFCAVVAAVPLRLSQPAPEVKITPIVHKNNINVVVLNQAKTSKPTEKHITVELGTPRFQTKPKPKPSLLQRGAAAGPQHGELSRIVQEHNLLRCTHGAPPLSWDPALARSAQKWLATSACSLTHSNSSYGENVARGVGLTGVLATKAWYTENVNYNFNLPQSQSHTKHFTQLVWKNTQKIGCAVHTCSSQSEGGGKTAVFCQYYPPSNPKGSDSHNVQKRVKSAAKCRAASFIQQGRSDWPKIPKRWKKIGKKVGKAVKNWLGKRKKPSDQDAQEQEQEQQEQQQQQEEQEGKQQQQQQQDNQDDGTEGADDDEQVVNINVVYPNQAPAPAPAGGGGGEGGGDSGSGADGSAQQETGGQGGANQDGQEGAEQEGKGDDAGGGGGGG